MNETREEMKILMKLFLGPEPGERLYERWNESISDDEQFRERAMSLMKGVVGGNLLKKHLLPEMSE